MAQPTVSSRTSDISQSSPGLTNTNAAAGTKRKRTTERKFYAVRQGKMPGIYDTWDECLAQVRGHKGATFKAFQSLHEAQAFMEGKLLKSTNTSGDQKFYAVQNGRVPGVYTDWTEAQAQIRGIKKPKHKKFNTRAEAEAFVAAGKKPIGFDDSQFVSPEEEIRRLIVRNSAPGLQTNGTYTPTDKDGNPYEVGRGPLPPGAEDGFDPNIKLSADGTIVNRTEEEKNKTKFVPKERDPPGMLNIWTDGSSLRNGQAGARAGVGVYFGPLDPKNVSEALKGSKQTNQRAELTAISRALDIAPRHRDVTIYTDSKYSIECVTNWYRKWEKNGYINSQRKTVENKDLVEDIREKIEERELLKKKTLFVWVKGHGNDPGNIAADNLAVQGSLSGRGLDEDGDDDELNGRDSETDEDRGDSTAADVDEDGDALDEDIKQAYRDMDQAIAEDSEDEYK